MLKFPAKTYLYHSNQKTLLQAYRWELRLSKVIGLNIGWLWTKLILDDFLQKVTDCSFK